MNYLQLVNRSHRESPHAGGDVAALALITSGVRFKLVGWVADAYNEIQSMCSQYNWKWMRAQALGDLVTSTMKYTIDALLGVSAGTTRFRRWQPETEDYRPTAYLASYPTNEWPLRFVEYEDFAMRFLRGDHTAGAPQFWSVHPDGSVLIGPKPDQAYKFRADYWRSNQTLALDADVPEMPADFHMIIVWKALNDSGAFDSAAEVVARSASHYSDLESRLIADQGQRITIAARPLGG